MQERTQNIEDVVRSVCSYTYFADFKYFKDSQTQIDNKEINLEINELIDGKDKFGQLIISNESDRIESCIKVSINELNDLAERLKTTPNNG